MEFQYLIVFVLLSGKMAAQIFREKIVFHDPTTFAVLVTTPG